jgi:TM2 domain-containing membrane protein YozV
MEENKLQQPMVFMNAGGAASSSSSSSSSSASGGVNGRPIPLKNKVAAGVLAILLGGLGIHKFYLGKPIQGILYLLLCWTFIPSFIALIEGIIYLVSSDESFAIKYGAKYF